METVLATALERQIWIADYFAEYVRASQYSPYMGKGATNVIVVKYDLETERGKTINIPLITRLKGQGVSGSQILEGNEEELGNYNCAISVEWRRHAVTVPKSTQFKTEIDLLNAAKDMLREWESERMRDDIINALYSIVPATTSVTPTLYGTITDRAAGGREILAANYIASESDKNTWLGNNSDRVLFGHTVANASSGVHATAMTTLETTDDLLTSAVGYNAKLMAKLTSTRKIRPYKLKDGREYFVMFTNPYSFRDLTTKDTAMTQANRDARPRDVEANPIFQDGDVIKDGIIYHQVEEQPIITGAGASGTTDVGVNLLCGAQALGVVWGQEPTPVTDRTRDYGFRPGVGIEELTQTNKLHFNGIQQGVVTVYNAVNASAA